MEQQGMTESRFYMWRAIFALAHADGIVTDKERAFVNGYLNSLPLSAEQKETLSNDLDHPQSINEMLIGIKDNNDNADFFQFAQMIVWCDGDYDEREQRIIDRLTSEQMNRFNKREIADALHQGHMAAILRRSIEDKEFKRQAKGAILGSVHLTSPEYHKNADTIALATAKQWWRTAGDYLGFKTSSETEEDKNSLNTAMEWMRQQAFSTPPADVFALWRAVFSLVGADGKVTREEEEYVRGMMQVFRFSEMQKQIIEEDLKSPGDTVRMFKDLQTAEFRRQFLIAARTIIWCDYEFADKEREVMNAIVAALAPAEKASLKEELDWIGKKTLPPETSEEGGNVKAMKGIFGQMVGFHNARSQKKAA